MGRPKDRSSCSAHSLVDMVTHDAISPFSFRYLSPKHLGYGIASGVSNVVAGAVGAVGMIVLMPVS